MEHENLFDQDFFQRSRGLLLDTWAASFARPKATQADLVVVEYKIEEL